jgi:hypothetical protein
MSRNNHPVEQEELMAYLDGELATDRAVEAAAHLERCAECQEFAAELRKISQEMMAWEVEPAQPGGIPTEIAVMLAEPHETAKKQKSWRMGGILITPQRVAGLGGVVVVFLLILAIATPNFLRSGFSAGQPARIAKQRGELDKAGPGYQDTTRNYGPENGKNSGIVGGLVPSPKPTPSSNDNYDSLNHLNSSGYVDLDGRLADAHKSRIATTSGTEEKAEAADEISPNQPEVPAVPMIARTAGLTLVAKDFDETRVAVEEILKRHNGYVGEMSVSAPADAGRALTATLRVPAPQLDAALSELKKLGRVEGESQSGEEVTAQYVDLEARLKNAQHTEQRLTEILRSRTGKLQDVLKVELEIDRVRGEIEQMQGEKKELTKRVAFSTVNATIKEEYHAKLQTAPPSTGSRFHNAAVDGYNSVIEGLISVGLFFLSAGPSLLIWAAILFFPVRWAWRKVRTELKKNQESAS